MTDKEASIRPNTQRLGVQGFRPAEREAALLEVKNGSDGSDSESEESDGEDVEPIMEIDPSEDVLPS